VITPGANDVWVGLNESWPVDIHDRVDECRPPLEGTFLGRCIKHQEANLLPEIGFIVTPNDTYCALELLAIDPQFAIQRLQRKALCEPGGRMVAVAQTG
jgi:hypothetical protein